MAVLPIRHVAGSNSLRFQLQRPDGGMLREVELPSPVSFPVEGRPTSGLVRELAWYLETFLDYPFSPETERADRVRAALRDWGTQAFEALFDSRDGGELLTKVTAGGYEELLLQIWSDDARILAWPWEALRDPRIGVLAHLCQIERRLDKVPDLAPVPAGLPSDRVNILLVIARPLDGDVKYHSIARPLVELIETAALPAYVHVLRPPTFDQLREHLRKRPGYYHLVHFDGHGNYGKKAVATSEHTYGAAEGELVFEDVVCGDAFGSGPRPLKDLLATAAGRRIQGDHHHHQQERGGLARDRAAPQDRTGWARRRGTLDICECDPWGPRSHDR